MENGAVGAAPSSPSAARVSEARAILDALTRIEARLDRVEAIARKALAEGQGAIAMVTDTADQMMASAQARGIDPDARLSNLVHAIDLLSSDRAIATLEATFGRIDQIRAVLESGVLDPAAVAIVGKAGQALAGAAAEPPEGVGMLGLVRAIGQDEVKLATGFLVRFARRLGAALRSPAHRLGAGEEEV